jgi:NitT/TauT family transport system substrate-binding protein
MKRRLPALLTAVLMTLTLGACSSGKSPGTEEVRIGYFPNITHAQALVGKADGTFAEAFGDGVTIDWKMFNAGPSEVEALFAGEVDIGYIGPGPAINAYIKSGGDVVVIAGATSAGAVLVARAGSGIESVKDLAGRKIAVPQYGNTQDLILRNLLKENGLSDTAAGGDVEILQVENPDVQTLFEKGELDAALVPEPWGSLLVEKTQAEIVLDYDEVWRNGEYPVAVVVVRKEFLEKHPDLVEAFLTAHTKIGDYIVNNPEDAKKVVNKEITELTGKSVSDSVLDSAFDRVVISNDPNRDAIMDMIQFSVDAGILTGVSGEEGLTDVSLLNKVLRAEGREEIS